MSNLNAARIDTYCKVVNVDSQSSLILDLSYNIDGCKTVVYKLFGDMLGVEVDAQPALINVNLGGNNMLMWNQTSMNYANEFVFSSSTGRTLAGKLQLSFTNENNEPYAQVGIFGIVVMAIW